MGAILAFPPRQLFYLLIYLSFKTSQKNQKLCPCIPILGNDIIRMPQPLANDLKNFLDYLLHDILGYHCFKIYIWMEYKCAMWNCDLPNSDSASDMGNQLKFRLFTVLVTNVRYGKTFNRGLFPSHGNWFHNILMGFSLLSLTSEYN